MGSRWIIDKFAEVKRRGQTHLHIVAAGVSELPEEIGDLTHLTELKLSLNALSRIPASIGRLTELRHLEINDNQLTELPAEFGALAKLEKLFLSSNRFAVFPPCLLQLEELRVLHIYQNRLGELPQAIGNLKKLQELGLDGNMLTTLPESIGNLRRLKYLDLAHNQLEELPVSFARLKDLQHLDLEFNKLEHMLALAYRRGVDELRSYLGSIAKPEELEKLYEAKLLLVGEGKVGKTSLRKALEGMQPRVGEPTTHGINIDSLSLPHPEHAALSIRLNIWDFGGQEIYRVTHQFFFSKRSIYLVLWEPRQGAQLCRVEEWLQLIRLRVGENAKVLVVSTHSKTENRIPRINRSELRTKFPNMIVDFLEVDSFQTDPADGGRYGVSALRSKIAEVAAGLDHMGSPFNRDWRKARDELLDCRTPHMAFDRFESVCRKHGMNSRDTRTLAQLMNDLGYIVYYDDDDALREEAVMEPEWLTKAIGFVLEDRKTFECKGILEDRRLREVWYDHGIENEPRFPRNLYPFFLRLMERFDVLYRLETGGASLVAQHVPDEPPPLPWEPGSPPGPGSLRAVLICVMEEEPPGLVPWMTVRTHSYAQNNRASREEIRLHWLSGIFLRHDLHGDALLHLQGKEFEIHVEAVWPRYFIERLQITLVKLIEDNWPGLRGRYYFAVPCRGRKNDAPCDERHRFDSLQNMLRQNRSTYFCLNCEEDQNVRELLFGFDIEDEKTELARIEEKLIASIGKKFAEFDQNEARRHAELKAKVTENQLLLKELNSRVEKHLLYMLDAIAGESRHGPRLFSIAPARADGFDIKSLFSQKFRLRLWCEAENCQHPVNEDGRGVYEFRQSREWLLEVAPYANFVVRLLKVVSPLVTAALPAFLGEEKYNALGIAPQLKLMDTITDKLMREVTVEQSDLTGEDGGLSPAERAGIRAFHSLLEKLDPHGEKMGLRQAPTNEGRYLWLCERHFQQRRPNIPAELS